MANIGRRPTVNGVKQILEVYIFDFERQIYGQNIQVEFCHKLREEVKFPSIEALKVQISRDIDNAKTFFEKQAK